MHYYAQERDSIDLFREEYAFLSNFYFAYVHFEGITYFNSESAYQAQKCADPADRKQFAELTADEAKRLGGKIIQRPDWEQVKLPLMERIVGAKFTQNPYLAKYLLETGDKVLKEGNRWGDIYWGVDLKNGNGENHLGKILMELRSELRKNGIPDAETVTEKQRFVPVEGISAVIDDITQSDCECIVNAAENGTLTADSVDRMLCLAAGKGFPEECEKVGALNVSDAKITKGGRLKAKYIIHTLGPHYGTENDEALLKQTYRNVLDLAKENDIHSIAFPVISAGKFSYPKKAAVQIAVESAAEWISENKSHRMNIEFVCGDIRMYDHFRIGAGSQASMPFTADAIGGRSI